MKKRQQLRKKRNQNKIRKKNEISILLLIFKVIYLKKKLIDTIIKYIHSLKTNKQTNKQKISSDKHNIQSNKKNKKDLSQHDKNI